MLMSLDSCALASETLISIRTPKIHQKNNIDEYMRRRVPRLVNMVNLD
jgi:hypothetical protein